MEESLQVKSQWIIHDKWAAKLGVDNITSKKINEFIDYPKKWLERNYPDRKSAPKECRLLYALFFDRNMTYDLGKSSKRL